MCNKYSSLVSLVDSKLDLYKNSAYSSYEEFSIKYEFDRPVLLDFSLELMDMEVPAKDTTLTDIANIIGFDHKVAIMDVGDQALMPGWNIGDYARLVAVRLIISSILLNSSSKPFRYVENYRSDNKILNLITLEISGI